MCFVSAAAPWPKERGSGTCHPGIGGSKSLHNTEAARLLLLAGEDRR